MKVSVGVSNRHVHLTRDVADILFGKNYEFHIKKMIKQPGQYAALETVTIKGPKNSIENVRVLGPIRKYNQVEISRTDAYKLGVKPPIRNSGDLIYSSPIEIIGPNGSVSLKEGCIITTRHLHITPQKLQELGLNENQLLSIKVEGEKSAILNNVHIRCSENSYFEIHIDTDDANANMINQDDEVELIINDK